MFKTLAFVSVLTTVVLAQSSTNTAPPSNSTTNPLIPAGISPACSAFLTSLNSDSSLTSCLSALTTATSPFAPGSTVTPTSATVTTALTGLCADSVSTSCPDNLIRSKITAFYTACTAELTTNKVPEVVRTYDILYTISPLRTSVCSKSDDGAWCVMSSTVTTGEVSGGASGSPLDLAHLMGLLYTGNTAALKRRAETSLIVPNMTTYHDTNLPFLFFKPTLDSTALCTACARQVLTAYINHESNVPYAPGISSSQLLDTQAALYGAVQEKCGANFLSGVVQAAGGLSGGILGSGAASVRSEYQSLIALVMGMGTLAVSFAL